MDLTNFLVNANSSDPNLRTQAQEQLQKAEETNLPVFLVSLVTELANDQKPAPSRQMAGLILKNTMTSKDEEKRKRLEAQWMGLDQNTKAAVKNQVVCTLESNTKEARSTAAQVCARIAAIELPLRQWDDLVPTLLRFVENAKNDFQKEATLTAIGYICEESDAEILQTQSNQILTAVVQGMRKEETNMDVRLAAATALYNSLEFVRGNMDNENERNYLMRQVCESTQAPDERIRCAAMQCLVKVVSLYYDKLESYMQALFGVTIESVRKDSEAVGLQGIEFWSAMCDVEIEMIQDGAEAECRFYVKGALEHLVKLLTECLTKQDPDADALDCNLAKSAGTCLCLVAQCVEDAIVPVTMQFISSNINNPDWKFREAATLAFGSILDGPSTEVIGPLVDQAVPMMLSHMTDEVTLVKDTTAWTIGRIADLHPDRIIPNFLKPVLEAMVKALEDEPCVASKAGWCIQNICNFWEDAQHEGSYPLSEVFHILVEALLKGIDRPDANEENLRESCYEGLNALLGSAGPNCPQCNQVIKQLVPVLLMRLDRTFGMEMESGAGRQEQSTTQGLLCGALQVVARKLGQGVAPFADQMMEMFIRVFSTRSSSVHEESLMAVGAIANATGANFEKYMPHFARFLYLGLKNYQEYQVCNIAVGVVCDIAAALGQKIAPYCDEIMTTLLENLRALELNRDVKPVIISCFGDIALNIGSMFEHYLKVVMNVMKQAGETKVPAHDEEMVEYLNVLRENICEAYTGILQGMKNHPESFQPHVQQVLEFVQMVTMDSNIDEGVIRSCVAVIGDLANVFSKNAKTVLGSDFIKGLVMKAGESEDEATREAAQWTMEQLTEAGVR